LKRKVILVTDGDYFAYKAVLAAAHNIGGSVITKSAGNPTPLTSEAILRMIGEAEKEPVVIMVDDSGHAGMGCGEEIMMAIIRHPEVEVLGVIAVASNTEGGEGVEVTESVTREGNVIDQGVDKHGIPKTTKTVNGDTVSILERMNIPVIIGLGDPGKMDYKDDPAKGAPITTKALKEIMESSRHIQQ